MKKNTKIIVSAIVSVVLLAAIIFASIKLIPKFTTKYDGEITIEVNDGEEELFNKKVGFNEGDTLIKVMESKLKLGTIDTQYGKMLVSINDVAAEDGVTFWSIIINGEFAMHGIETLPFEDGDVLTFTLTKIE